MRLLRRILLHNLGLKILALAISFSFWIIYTAEPFADVGYNVPIAFVNVPAGLALAGNTPNMVDVRLRGRSGLLRHLTPEELSFTVDLAGSHPGEISVHLTPNMVHIPYGTEVVLITPAQFRMTLLTSQVPLSEPE